LVKASGLLRTYLEDHHAGSTAGLELARRVAGSEDDPAAAAELREIADEIAADREVLKRLMDEVEASSNRFKDAAAWTGEKLGRLKPNNRLFSRSPLSRLIELEGLVLGVTGKLAMWESLTATFGRRLGSVDLDRMIARAEDQRNRLEALRLAAAADALTRD
jgi:hypothetical protein